MQDNLFRMPTVQVSFQLTIFFYNDGERDLFFPSLKKAEFSALEFLKAHDEWTQIDIECCATQRLTNDTICAMLNEDSGWMIGRHVFESVTEDGEILETESSRQVYVKELSFGKKRTVSS